MGKISYLGEALPWEQFIAENQIDLKERGILEGFSLTGPSPDIHDIADLAHRVTLLGHALGQLGAGDEVQILFDRLPAEVQPEQHYAPQHLAAKLVADELRSNSANHWTTPTRMYFSHQYPSAFMQFISRWLDDERKSGTEVTREYALRRFQAMREASRGAITLRPLTQAQMFGDLLYRVTYTTDRIAPPSDGRNLSQIIGSAERQINGQFPMIDGWYLRPIVITAYPADTAPQMLAPLLEYQGYLTVSCRYAALTTVHSKAYMKREKGHWIHVSIGGLMGIIRKAFKMDTSGLNPTVQKLIDHIEVAEGKADEGWPFGRTSVIAIVRDQDEAQADFRAHELLATLHNHGIMARLELAGAARAITNTWPGHLIMEQPSKYAQRHRLVVTGFNFADMAMPATYWEGSENATLTCSGTASIPFGLPLSVNGLGHMLWVGPSGTGKSTLLSTLACSLLSIPDSKIAWLDLDHSSFVLSHLLGAAYHDLGTQGTPPLCPLAALDREGGLEWLAGWFERLFQRRKGFELDERQMEDFMLALRTARRMGIRDLLTFRTAIEQGEEGRNRIRRILKEIIDYYGHVFGGSSEATVENRVTVYEMRGLMGLPRYIAAPAIELLLHEIVSKLDGTPSWVLADEFWSLLGDEISAAWLFDTLRTLRKKNASFIGCTQSLIEITNSPYRDLLLESCPAKIFLPNHAASNAYTSENYLKIGVSPHEISRIACSSVGDFFYQSPHGSRAATCYLGEVGKAVCASTGYKDIERARGYLKDGTDFLTRWLQESGIHLPAATEAVAGRGGVAEPDQHLRNGYMRSGGTDQAGLAHTG